MRSTAALLLLYGATILAVAFGMRWIFPTNVGFETNVNPVLLSEVGRESFASVRHWYLRQKLLRLEFAPYTGFHHPARVEDRGEFQGVKYHFTTNNRGFLTPYDVPGFAGGVDIDKGPDDRVVVVTGGSAAFGWGASATDKTFAALLEAHLKRIDPAHHWRVYNLGMGGWIAYQEYIALDLYASELKPDWIILFDGRNDVAIHTKHGERVPGHFLYGGLRKLNALFENLTESRWDAYIPILRYREIARRLADVATPQPEIDDPEEVDRASRFYVHTVEAIAQRFSSTQILVVTQPVSWYPGSAPGGDDAALLRRGYASIIAGTAELQARIPNLHYEDGTEWLPPALNRFLVDDCHLSDEGHAIVAAKLASLMPR